MVADENGVKSLDKLETIVAQIKGSDLARDPELLQKVLGDYDATRATKGFVNQLDWMEKLKREARSWSAINEAYDRRRQSAAGRVEKSWNNVKEAISDAFTPERIERFVKGVERAAELFGNILDNLQAVVGLMAVAKFGPGTVGAVMAGGGMLAKTGAGAAMNAAGAGALGAKG